MGKLADGLFDHTRESVGRGGGGTKFHDCDSLFVFTYVKTRCVRDPEKKRESDRCCPVVVLEACERL